VFTGHGIHAYWLLSESVDAQAPDMMERIEGDLGRLCDLVGGDSQVCEIARVMRLPGSHNSKFDGEMIPVEVLTSSGKRYHLEDLEEMLTSMSPIILRKERPKAITLGEEDGYDEMIRLSGYKPPVDIEKRLNGMMFMGGDINGVHPTQLSVTASMAKDGRDIEEIVKVVFDATQLAVGDYYGKRWNWTRERRVIRGMTATALVKYPPKKLKTTTAPDNVDSLDQARADKAKKETSKPKPDAKDSDAKSKADSLVKLASGAVLFHDAEGTCFADVKHGGHRETWPIGSVHFRKFLTGLFYKATGSAPKADDLKTAINVLEAKAHFDGSEQEVHLRVGGHAGKIYLDLGNKDWEAVEIDEAGWRIVKNPPLRFRRTKGTLPVGTPVRGGSIELLRKYVNVKTDDDFVLFVFWLLAVLRPAGPYPILMVSGEHGAAKSSATKIARSIVDPNTMAVRTPPKEDRDLFIAAHNSHVLAYDNISSLPPWLADSFCRIATGGGFATRELYENLEEVLLDAIRPLVLNGINDLVSRADLTDRAILLNLEHPTIELNQT
jgi:hypothetical protein